MSLPYLRLRQICLVAADLSEASRMIEGVLRVPVCYQDPGVGKYGLHNALFAMGGTFLEVVSPLPGVKDTAAERYLSRRGGDGGYMFIVDCDNLEARRTHFEAKGLRMVEDLKAGNEVVGSEAIHLHPRDTGGCLLSIDRHTGGADMMGGYFWAGAHWKLKAAAPSERMLLGADMQSADPEGLARRWGEILERPINRISDGVWEIALDHGFARFTPLMDERGEGLSCVHLGCADPEILLGAARAAGLLIHEDGFDLAGVRFKLVRLAVAA